MLHSHIIPLLLLLALSQNPASSRVKLSNQKQSKPASAQQPTTDNQRGTESSPIFVKEIPTAKTQGETAEETKERNEKSSNDWHLVIATYILGAIGGLQLLVFGYQAYKLKQTVEAAAQQSQDTKRAIAETARAATATETVAQHIESNLATAIRQSQSMEESVAEAARLASAMELVAKDISVSARAAVDSVTALRERTAQQMRAYLTVIVGSAMYQEKQKNIRFQGLPMLLNTGSTPAHKVGYVAAADILPVPLPDDYAFPLAEEFKGASVVGAHQNNQLFALVENFVDENEVPNIKVANGKALYTWGVIRYEDIFGEPHITKFCQLITWLPNGNVFGIFIPRHNEGT